MPKKPHQEKIVTQHYISSNKGIQLTIPDNKIQQNPLIKEDDRVFSYTRYSQESHPLINTNISLPSSLLTDVPRCLDMPIRLSGQKAYNIPQEWENLQQIIYEILSFEHAHNHNWKDYHTYITVDNSFVKVGSQQRRGGLHVDGFQGERINPKTKITRNYIVSNNGGTHFYDQRFIIADPKHYNVFHGFDMQTPGWNTQTYQVAEENKVYFMNAYSVHESGLASRDGQRFFLRVTFDLKKFDRLGNTHNSMLDYQWHMIERDTQAQVESPDISHLENSPYIFTSNNNIVVNKPLLVGVSGKPGSGKNWITLKIIQELNFEGFKAQKFSLASEVYKQLNSMIDDILKQCSLKDFISKYKIKSPIAAQQFYQILIEGDVGDKHPIWGYHRRNQTVRELLSALSYFRREENSNYWLEKMLQNVQNQQVQAAVFSDLRFENEAEYLLENKGFLIRAELDSIWLQETQGRNPGYKYSDEYLNSPIESALDNYKKFDIHTTAQNFKVEEEIENIILTSSQR